MTSSSPIRNDVARRRVLSLGAVAATLVATASGLLSALWKSLCTGPTFGAGGATELEFSRYGTLLCYSDQRALWAARNLGAHVFPYQGTFTPDGGLTGGVVEYPTLSGLFLWAVGLPASTDRGFVLSAGVTLAVAAGIIAFLLHRLSGHRVWLWSFAPAVLVYSAYNVDMLPSLATVVAIAIVLWPGSRIAPVVRAYLGAIALGVGAGLKLYPLMFALPLALWLGFALHAEGRLRARWWHSIGVLATAGGVLLLANLPFAIWQTEGWLASFQFQSARRLDDNTMAIWWWVPHLLGFDVADRTSTTTTIAAVATAIGLAAAVTLGWRSARRFGVFPWLQVSGAMLAAYMLLNKVNSPQYILWLIPFFVLLRVPVRWVLVYFAADLALFFGYFRRLALMPDSSQWIGLETLLGIGVLLRAGMLAYFFFAFLRADVSVGRKTLMSGSTSTSTSEKPVFRRAYRRMLGERPSTTSASG